jgi:flavin reductase (DIM6/NTAB) family NADH-FMN oxidoreductase RutF
MSAIAESVDHMRLQRQVSRAATRKLAHYSVVETYPSAGPLRGSLMFEEIVATLDYPMFIVTVARDDEVAGCLVGFASQCSIEPARFLVCLSKKNRTFELAQRSHHMAVHLVPASQKKLATLFGGSTGDELDKFEHCAWSPGPGGVPVLEGCPSWFAGPIVARMDGGDHAVHIIEPTAGHAGDEVPLLTFQDAREIDPGHEA